MTLRLDGRVAIVTGAGGGLGRAHALALASRGAKLIINDLGGARDGSGTSMSPAQVVVDEIVAGGGEAIPNGANVNDPAAVQAMVDEACARWGRVDILVNNAGILRDKSFAKMTLEDFRAVLEVHLMGSVVCTKAVWDLMRDQAYGRIVMTTSSSGLYGNFGQSNYSAAKLGLVGLMNTLALEGAKYNVRVNALAPTAATRMTNDVIPETFLPMLAPEAVAPAVLALVGEDAPNRTILCAGAGSFERAYITLTKGVFIGIGPDAPDQVVASFERISDRSDETLPENGAAQTQLEVTKMMAARGAAGNA